MKTKTGKDMYIIVYAPHDSAINATYYGVFPNSQSAYDWLDKEIQTLPESERQRFRDNCLVTPLEDEGIQYEE